MDRGQERTTAPQNLTPRYVVSPGRESDALPSPPDRAAPDGRVPDRWAHRAPSGHSPLRHEPQVTARAVPLTLALPVDAFSSGPTVRGPAR